MLSPYLNALLGCFEKWRKHEVKYIIIFIQYVYIQSHTKINVLVWWVRSSCQNESNVLDERYMTYIFYTNLPVFLLVLMSVNDSNEGRQISKHTQNTIKINLIRINEVINKANRSAGKKIQETWKVLYAHIDLSFITSSLINWVSSVYRQCWHIKLQYSRTDNRVDV